MCLVNKYHEVYFGFIFNCVLIVYTSYYTIHCIRLSTFGIVIYREVYIYIYNMILYRKIPIYIIGKLYIYLLCKY